MFTRIRHHEELRITVLAQSRCNTLYASLYYSEREGENQVERNHDRGFDEKN